MEMEGRGWSMMMMDDGDMGNGDVGNGHTGIGHSGNSNGHLASCILYLAS